MACFAVLSELPPMNVVGFVAPDASHWQIALGARHMARMTTSTRMRSRQRKARGHCMVETRPLPGSSIVTAGTFRSEPTLVIRVTMTSYARARRILEGRRAMATLAADRGVAADQREPRQIMINRGAFSPRSLIVALLATLTQLPLVRISGLVTSDTGHRRLVAVDISYVTLGTGRLRVSALQWKSGRFPMIKAD